MIASLHAQSSEFAYMNQEFVENLNIYPNPSPDGKMYVEFDTNNVNDKITIRVFNLVGKEVPTERQHLSGRTHYKEMIDVSSQPRGVYMIEISNGKKKKIRRIPYI